MILEQSCLVWPDPNWALSLAVSDAYYSASDKDPAHQLESDHMRLTRVSNDALLCKLTWRIRTP